MKRFRIYALLLLTSCLSSCSFVEHFVIFNTSNTPIAVRYEIEPPAKGMPLFNTTFTAYSTTKRRRLSLRTKIDWDKPIKLSDSDTEKNTVTVLLPANSALVIGELSNEHYYHHNQKFTNNGEFNLASIEIVNSNMTNTTITRSEFDTYFRKEDGIISYSAW